MKITSSELRTKPKEELYRIRTARDFILHASPPQIDKLFFIYCQKKFVDEGNPYPPPDNQMVAVNRVIPIDMLRSTSRFG